MSIFTYLDGVLVGTSAIRLRWGGEEGYQGLPAAADGTGAQGGIILDDPTGTISTRGWQLAKVIEADCTSAPVLFYGTLADRTYRRGPYTQGPGRQIDMTINDHNGFLSLHIAGGDTASRPSETDTARLDWLINDSGLLDNLVYDLGFVNPVGRVLDAANLQGQYPAEIINDMATGGEIFFTYWDQSAQKVGLFFDAPGATTWTCSLSISNDLADITYDTNGIVSGTTYPPFKDGELVADPVDVYSRIRFVYTGGAVWRTHTATSTEFFPSPLGWRSFQVEMDKVGLQSTAITFADRILQRDSQEREVVKFTVQLPSTKVGLIQAGMRINLTFTHLPGFETGAYSRIERINIVPTEGNPLLYDVTCECSTTGLTTGVGSGGGSTTPYPSVPPSGTGHWYEGSMAFFSDNGMGGGGFGYASFPVSGTTTTASTNTAGGAFDPSTLYTVHYEITGTTPTDLAAMSLSFDTAPTYPPGTTQIGWTDTPPNGAAFTYDGTFTSSSTISPGTVAHMSAKAQPLAGGGQTVSVSWWVDPDGWEVITPEQPTPGKPVEDITPTPDPDGVTTVFTTPDPYAGGSLHVTMNGSELDSGVDFTETTSTTFTFTDPPPTNAQIVVWYIAL